MCIDRASRDLLRCVRTKLLGICQVRCRLYCRSLVGLTRDLDNQMFLWVLNVNLDHYDFPCEFHYICWSSNDCVLLPAIIDSAMSEDRPTQLLWV